jgi:two-component system NtrC family sensor kinase
MKSFMKKYLLCLSLLLAFLSMQAQYKVKFLLKENSLLQRDSIYLAGTFNEWNGDFNKNYLLKKGPGNEHFIILNLPPGEIQYKYHRGNWNSGEMSVDGDEAPNRVRMINKDIILTDTVKNWQDQMILVKQEALAQSTSDTARVKILTALAGIYRSFEQYYNRDSAFAYAQKAYSLLQKVMISDAGNIAYNLYLFNIQDILALLFHAAGSYPQSLQLRLANLELAEPLHDNSLLAYALQRTTSDYVFMKDYKNALVYAKLADSVSNTYKHNSQEYYEYQWNKFAIVTACYNLKIFDSALFYLNQMQALINDPGVHFYYVVMDAMRGDIYAEKKNTDSAFYYYRSAISYAREVKEDAPAAQKGLAKFFKKENKIDSALYYARLSYVNFENRRLALQLTGNTVDYWILDLYPLLAELYKANGQMDSAYYYLQLAVSIKDTLYNSDKIVQFQTLTFNEASRKQQLELQAQQAQEKFSTKIKMYSLVTGFIVVLIISFILLKNNKQKQKANHLLVIQKKKVESTLSELESTQSQLIQSEKMASLGELTAGIAHEIQNPLNFVNNFSDVNTELLQEMKQELDKGNVTEATTLANDVIENEQKINHHGKRADAIVKGMLQHSRSNTGIKEPTDLNALADEYLRLCYHGLRAKDKSFNATIKTDFDASIGHINIVPQDIARAILNLLTNAFYAVNEKKKMDLVGYEPAVSISTKNTGDHVEIKVMDNGNGIPQKVVDKIFQPFFTTKPTGQGTGLGLSLSYDIIKAHGGEIKVNTATGSGSEFIITLPV